jgi:hypothetical protein
MPNDTNPPKSASFEMKAGSGLSPDAVAAAFQGWQVATRSNEAPPRQSFTDFLANLDLSEDHRKQVLAAGENTPGNGPIVRETRMREKLHDLRPDLDNAVRNRSGVKPEGL